LFARAKTAVYENLIAGLRYAQRQSLAGLRSAAAYAPAAVRGFVDGFIDAVELITDLHISLILAIVSIVGGIISGLKDMIVGLSRWSPAASRV